MRPAIEEGVGGAGVSCPGIGVGAFSEASIPQPRGVFGFAGVFVESVGDGRWFNEGPCNS